MPNPNFFIIGAPRSGTTSLYMWLKEHPQIYMPKNKEPWFFSKDIFQVIDDRCEYERLFEDANSAHRRIGEASTIYLYSKVSVSAIEKRFPGSLYIVLLRNPIDLIRSLHQVLQRNSGSESVWENESDFEVAWNLQSERLDGKNIPSGCPSKWLLQYREFGLLGKYCDRLTRLVDRRRILFLSFDKLTSSPEEALKDVFRFLDVDCITGINMSAHNSTHGRRSIRLLKLMDMVQKYKVLMPCLPKKTGILNAIDHWNTKPIPINELTPEFRTKLVREYVDDVELLREVSGLDLAGWPK